MRSFTDSSASSVASPFPSEASSEREEYGIVLHGLDRMVRAMSHDSRDVWPHRSLNEYYFSEDDAGKLGSGSFGTVFLSHVKGDPSRRCALKVCQVSDNLLEVLNQNMKRQRELNKIEGVTEDVFSELYFLHRIRHTNILHSHAAFLHGGRLVIAMPIMTSLLKVLNAYREANKGAGIPSPICANVTRQLLEGLEYLHAFKVIHRDLKSDNVLVTNGGVIKICDFGLSIFLENDSCHGYAGTRQFMDQDVVESIKNNNSYSYPADIWSVGMVILEMAINYPDCMESNALSIPIMMRANGVSFKNVIRAAHSWLFNSIRTYDEDLLSMLDKKVLTNHWSDRMLAGELLNYGWLKKKALKNLEENSQIVAQFLRETLNRSEQESQPSTYPNVERLNSMEVF
ncbi:hypothetical protein L596_009705 [Steinernema carpocapsae]|uniref:non-specific serine/threonine protein kinase n=1 Tax=Steinernema carpocapsae TaxID=34508 RepID=A0A4U5PHF8_STECR|nr:hypothetical protein L596_009705 [Steinernema carpocapsae]